jgi:hypothetical protein
LLASPACSHLSADLMSNELASIPALAQHSCCALAKLTLTHDKDMNVQMHYISMQSFLSGAAVCAKSSSNHA